jgi:transcriptional regulator with XRE-family HTH domain
MVEELAFNVGRKVRKAREEQGLSLRQLSEKADVSPSTIHKIESNQISPTLGTILKITRALGKDLQFFLDGDGRTDVTFCPGERRQRIHPPGLKFVIELLSKGISDQRFSALFLIVPPGGRRGSHLLHLGEELQHCLSGTVEFTIHGKRYLLEEGDTVHFKSDLKHSWVNVGKEEARLLMICAPALFVGRASSEP